MSSKPKPLIVGLAHWSEFPGDITGERDLTGDTYLKVELRRALKLLGSFPPNTKIGIEMSPEDFAFVKHAVENGKGKQLPMDVLFQIARYAIEQGYEVIPLDSNTRVGRARKAISITGTTISAKTAKYFTREIGEQLFLASSRSVSMGTKINNGKLPISFIGNGHAVELESFGGRLFRYSFSTVPRESLKKTFQVRKAGLTKEARRFNRFHRSRFRRLNRGK